MNEGDAYVELLKKTYSDCSCEVLLSTIKLYKSLIKNEEYSEFKVMYTAGVNYFLSLIDKK